MKLEKKLVVWQPYKAFKALAAVVRWEGALQ